MLLREVATTDQSRTTILIRLVVGLVFLSEGIQKFLFEELRGAGRFEKIGLPSPELLGPMVGGFEIICGVMILLGIYTRLAVIPIIVIMIVAFATTKSEILAQDGFWEMLHRSRTDFAMLLCGLFLLVKGSGGMSYDRKLMR
jgi:putative oxidoreductase